MTMDDSLMDEEEVVDTIEQVAKIDKSHAKAIVKLHAFRYGRQIAIISVAHDSAKLWILNEDRKNRKANLVEKATLGTWRFAVQSADVSQDGRHLIVVSIDSKVYDISLEDIENNFQIERDFDCMEVVHVSIAPTNNTFLTSGFSCGLAEIEIANNSTNFFRKEKFSNSKAISCLKYSNDMKYIAVGQNDGVIELFETATLKPIHKYEVHSMKVRKIAFLPGDERFLSGCDDKLIKLNSLTDLGQSETNRTNRALRIYAAHSGPIYGLEIDEKSGGTRFASSSSAQIFLWHIEISTPISVIPTEHSGLITGLSFSPTSRHLLSAGENALICCYRIPASGEESPIPEEEEIQEPESQAQEENMEIPPAEHLEQNEYPLEYQQYAAENYAENQQAAQYEQQLYQHQELPQEYPQEPAENVHEFQPHTIKTEPEASYSPPPQFSQHPQKQEYDA